MPQRPQAYHRPQTLEEALHLLAQPDSAALAGGTRLLANDIPSATIVDLQALPLAYLTIGEGQVTIGAMLRLYQLEESSELQNGPADLLRQAVYQSGPNTFRHAATVGGVIASRDPQSELLALLLVLEAQLEVASLQGTTIMPLADYLAPQERPQGLITQIHIPWQAGRGAITRVARTPADQPIVAVVAWRVADEEIRLAAVGISPRPLRLPDGDFSMQQTLADAQALVIHRGDFLGSVAYRREMLSVLVGRAIEMTVG